MVFLSLRGEGSWGGVGMGTFFLSSALKQFSQEPRDTFQVLYCSRRYLPFFRNGTSSFMFFEFHRSFVSMSQ